MDTTKFSTTTTASHLGYYTKKSLGMSKEATSTNIFNEPVTYSSAFRRRRGHCDQDLVLVWLDASIDENDDDFQKSLAELRKIVVSVKRFTDADRCFQYLRRINDKTIFLIVSGSLGQQTVPRIHHLNKLDSIFVFCRNKDLHKLWARDWSKIEGVHGSIKSICKGLKRAIRDHEQLSIPMSFIPKS
ncbi:unnamed protein product [Rotaria magnacalcarata]|uniref:Uncharacterized protein n=4 Tax=Rotaria magnacalcarata TaxID=392030 RepID=A0A820C5W7_9BILA|nr:unnamed protein product [Rotaria magnacalcarata]CAF4210904.1 unnamed protein product [Rotaria magnacalcarata]CAF4306054.1 unnamed protein product [Rotaria magnacalcarata]